MSARAVGADDFVCQCVLFVALERPSKEKQGAHLHSFLHHDGDCFSDENGAPSNGVRSIMLRKSSGLLSALMSKDLCAWIKMYVVKTVTCFSKSWPFLSEFNNHVCLY